MVDFFGFEAIQPGEVALRLRHRAILSLIALLAARGELHAAILPWTYNGNPACVSDSLKSEVCIVSDGSGGVLLVWQDWKKPNRSFPYAQRLTGAGQVATGWSATGVRACTLDSVQAYTKIAGDGGGGSFVAWQDGRFRATGVDQVFLQHFTAAGALSPGWSAQGLQISTGLYGAEFPQVQPDGAGGCFVAWDDPIFVQHLLGNGTRAPGWPSGGLPATSIVSDQFFSTVGNRTAADGSGGLLIAWTDFRGGTFDVYAQRLTSSGAAAAGWSPAGTVLAGTGGSEIAECLAGDGSGGAFVVWTGTSGIPLTIQRVSSAGAVAPGWPAAGRVLAAAFGYYPTVVDDGSGGAYVAWPAGAGASTPQLLQHVTSSGAIASGWPSGGVYLCDLGNAIDPSAASDGALGIIGAWADRRSWRPKGAVYAGRVASVGDVDVPLAEDLERDGTRVFPNPARRETNIFFTTSTAGPVRVAVLDVTGREIRPLADGELPAGEHRLQWNGVDRGGAEAPPGIYLLRIERAGRIATKRIALIR